MKKAIKNFFLFVGIIAGVAIIISSISGIANKDKKVKAYSVNKTQINNASIITIDGNDYDAGVRVNLINVWSNYQSRTYSHSLSHGEKVTLVSRGGDWVKIKDSRGRIGYVTYFFIKEYK